MQRGEGVREAWEGSTEQAARLARAGAGRRVMSSCPSSCPSRRLACWLLAAGCWLLAVLRAASFGEVAGWMSERGELELPRLPPTNFTAAAIPYPVPSAHETTCLPH